MKTAPASVMRTPPYEPPMLNRIVITSAFFRKLSPKAEKNWHQNRGAKRRLRRRLSIEGSSSFGAFGRTGAFHLRGISGDVQIDEVRGGRRQVADHDHSQARGI